MMRRSIRSSFLILAGAAAVLGFGLTQAVSAAVVISDSFTNNATNRASGKSLNNVEAESGNATWGASRFIFTADGAVTSSDIGPSAWVSTPVINGLVTLKADVDPSDDNWSAIYLTNDVTKGQAVYTNFQLLLNIYSGGGWNAYANGTDNKIATGHVTLKDDLNTLSLIYDPSSNKVTAKINDVSVLNNYALGTFTPVIKTAGMFMNHEGSTFDNFKLTVVPEPAALGSLIIGGVLALKKRPTRK